VERQDDLMDVESVSDELYGLPLDEFTPARTDREKEAKSAGDQDLAAQIHRLAKPNLVAWEATATRSGEQLRELSREQHQLVYAFVQQARGLAKAAGRKVSEDTARGLEDTLRAALADQDAAEALAAGRLTEGMQNSGFGSPTTGGRRPAASVREKPAAVSSPTVPPGALEKRKRAEVEVEAAQSAADEAITARQETQAQLEAADQAVADTSDRIKALRRELDEMLQAQSAAHKDQQRAKAAFDRADRAARDAQQRLTKATDRLDRLQG
jgi:hypothetical protein